jgi:hypothetical protein
VRILLDEDVAVQALDPLRHILRPHQVDHVKKIGWSKKKDVFVFADAARAGYDVLLTKNVGQMSVPEELAALKKAGIHHITYEQKGQGLDGLGRALGSIFAAMSGIVKALEAESGQRLVTINSVAGTRHQMTDPAVDPPPYWPR